MSIIIVIMFFLISIITTLYIRYIYRVPPECCGIRSTASFRICQDPYHILFGMRMAHRSLDGNKRYWPVTTWDYIGRFVSALSGLGFFEDKAEQQYTQKAIVSPPIGCRVNTRCRSGVLFLGIQVCGAWIDRYLRLHYN